MTTLAENTPRAYEGVPVRIEERAVPVIASDIIFEGAAVGKVDASGHARPLVGGDEFVGFADAKANNSAGVAAAINVDVKQQGFIQLTVTGAVITDIGQPVYALDDNDFSFSPVGRSFIGYAHRFASAGVMIVAFNALNYVDPYGEYSVREAISINKTLDSEDSGKLFWVDTDAVTVTLPAVATPALCKLVNGGAFGAVALTISPAAADSIEGPDITAADNKDIINTKATARRGDFAVLGLVDTAGYAATQLKGTWAREA